VVTCNLIYTCALSFPDFIIFLNVIPNNPYIIACTNEVFPDPLLLLLLFTYSPLIRYNLELSSNLISISSNITRILIIL